MLYKLLWILRFFIQATSMCVIGYNLYLMTSHMLILGLFFFYNLLELIYFSRSLFQKPKNISKSFYAWVSALIIALYPTFIPYFTIISTTIPFFDLVIGMTMQFLAIGIELIAILTLRSSFTQLPEAHRFVKYGLYRYIRHPLYASYTLSMIGIVIEIRTWQVLLFTLFFILLEVIRAKDEERVLTKVFPEYSIYKQQTGMFFPRISYKVNNIEN